MMVYVRLPGLATQNIDQAPQSSYLALDSFRGTFVVPV
jgi:hypothetical protein